MQIAILRVLVTAPDTSNHLHGGIQKIRSRRRQRVPFKQFLDVLLQQAVFMLDLLLTALGTQVTFEVPETFELKILNDVAKIIFCQAFVDMEPVMVVPAIMPVEKRRYLPFGVGNTVAACLDNNWTMSH